MRIQRLHLRDIGPFTDTLLEFPLPPEPGRGDIHILVGPNGAGKSTLLYALAALVGGLHGWELLLPRLRAPGQPLAELETDEGEGAVFGATVPGQAFQPGGLFTLPGPWASKGRDPYVWMGTRSGALATFRAGMSGSTSPLSTAVFAYSGSRVVTPARVQGTAPLPANPLDGALTFTGTANAQVFAQWLVNLSNQESRAFHKRATAVDPGERGEAEARMLAAAKARLRIEESIGRVIGEPVRIEVRDDPWDVLMERRGVKTRLDVLPDGLQSILSWLGDVLMRLDRLPWVGNLPVVERPFILLLDEVDIHLHPAWQRTILPMVQGLFPNAHVFVTTHSPFVIGSVKGAWVHPLDLVEREAVARPPVPSKAGASVRAVLRTVMGVSSMFDPDTEEALDRFYQVRTEALTGMEGALERLEALAADLSARGAEVRAIVLAEVDQVAARLGHTP